MCARNKSEKLEDSVISYIDAHLCERISSATVAEALKVNPGYLNTAFKKATGLNLMKFIHMRKTERANELLSGTDEGITRISAELGYFDQSHFCRKYKQIMGVTPKQYREAIRAKMTD